MIFSAVTPSDLVDIFHQTTQCQIPDNHNLNLQTCKIPRPLAHFLLKEKNNSHFTLKYLDFQRYKIPEYLSPCLYLQQRHFF